MLPATHPPYIDPLLDPAANAWAPPPLGAPCSEPPAVPPAPPAPGAPRRGKGRFTAGLVVGIALTGAAVGGYTIGTNRSSGTDSGATATAIDDGAAPAIGEGVSSIDLGSGSTIAELVDQARPSIVSVHQSVTQRGPMGSVQGTAAGTGWVLASDGYLVTNNHVIAQGGEITVTFADGTSATAQVVAADSSRDLAVLHVERDDLVPLAIGDSDDLSLGDSLIAIGYALDLSGEPSVTSGILSAKQRTITTENGETLVNLLQTDTAINPGNSGGPLLNSRGEVVGINTAVAGQAENIGFAIAITPVLDIIEELQGGTVTQKALLGVSTQLPADATAGAEIVDISNGTAAAGSDLRVGDVIVEVDGEAIDDPAALGTAIASRRPGDQVEVTVVRNGAEVEISLTLGARND